MFTTASVAGVPAGLTPMGMPGAFLTTCWSGGSDERLTRASTSDSSSSGWLNMGENGYGTVRPRNGGGLFSNNNRRVWIAEGMRVCGSFECIGDGGNARNGRLSPEKYLKFDA